MEIELGSFPKYENVRQNAFWLRTGIDTCLSVNEDNIECCRNHLLDCEKNPTIGLLARKKYITGRPMNYPTAAFRNSCYMKKQPEIKILRESVKNKIKTLYPRTKTIRKYIIDNDRVILDGVEKSRKYTFSDKLMIMLKRLV